MGQTPAPPPITRSRLLQAGAAAAAVLVACAPSRAPATVKQEAPATVQFWALPTWQWREDVGKEITDPLLAANPWLTLDIQYPAGNLMEKFLTASAGGSPPDIYSGGSYWDQQVFVDGATRSLEEFLRKSKVLKKADIWESLRRDVEFRGHMTSIPYGPDTREIFTHWESAQQAGLDPAKSPATWSEMEAAALKAYRGGAGEVERIGWDPLSGQPQTWMVPYWQIGGETTTADQTKVTLFNDRATRAVTFVKRIYDRQGGWPAIDAFVKSRSTPNSSGAFMGGGVTYIYTTLSSRGTTFNTSAPNMRFNISSYPLPDDGGSVANYGGCHTFPIAKGSKQPDAAWLFIEHVTAPEHNVKWAVRYDRVPIRDSSTRSQAYIQGDPGRALQAEEMKKRRFVIAAPGGAEMVGHQDVMTPVLKGELSIQDALKEKERLLQEILDRYLVKANAVKP